MFQSITIFDNTITLYPLFNNLATVAQLILVACFLKEYKETCTFPFIVDKYLHKKSKRDFFFGWIFMCIELIIIFAIGSLVNNLTYPIISEIFLGDHSGNFFTRILVAPVVSFLLLILFKYSPLKCWDIVALITSAALIFYKIACYCSGCCNGIEYGTTFYNYVNERYEMPVALIEAACAVVIFVILLIMHKHKKKDGILYPSFILMYCGSRFCSEFLRDDYPDVLGPLKGYHILCIIGFVLGLIYLFVVLKFGTRITEFFETRNKAYLEKKLKEYDEKHPRIHRKNRKNRKKR